MGVTFSATRLPHVDRRAKLTNDDHVYQDQAIEFELLERMRLVFGAYLAGGGSWGIVDSSNPLTIRDSMPLRVEAMEANPLRLRVSAGTTVAKSGTIATVEADVENVTLPSTAANSIYVLYTAFTLVEEDVRLNRYQTLIPSYYAYPSDSQLLVVKSLADYQALSANDASNAVPLAIITVIEDCPVGAPPTKSLVIDMTTNTYGWNRPWFSPIDVKHRAERGSGGDESAVPHGLTLEDLTSNGSLGLLDGQTKSGVVYSKAYSQSTAPGQRCIETLTGRVRKVEDLVLNASNVTANSLEVLRYLGYELYDASKAIPYAYVELNGYPLPDSIICWRDGDTDDAYELAVYAQIPGPDLAQQQITTSLNNYVYPCWVPPGSNLLVFPLQAKSVYGATNVKVAYLDAVALRPSAGAAETLGTSVTFAVPESGREAVICDGAILTSLSNPTLSFADLGPLPSHYKVFGRKSDSAATIELLRSPQPVLGPKKVTDFSGTAAPDSQPLGEAYLRVGLAYGSVGNNPDLNLRVTLSGKDASGASISETVAFIGSDVEIPEDIEYVRYQWEGSGCDGAGCLTGLLAIDSEDESKLYPNIHSHYWVRTNQKFYPPLTGIVVTAAANLRPEATIQVQSLLDPMDTAMLRRVCPVAEVSWNGTKVCQIRDVRPVVCKLELPASSKPDARDFAWASVPLGFYALADGAGERYLVPVLSERFDDQRNSDVLSVFLPSETDSFAGLKVRAYPQFANGLPVPEPMDEQHTYFMQRDATLWVSRAVPLTQMHTHHELIIALAGPDLPNNVFVPQFVGAEAESLIGGPVLVRFLYYDTVGNAYTWTTWRNVESIVGPMYRARMQEYDMEFGYTFVGFQIAIRNFARFDSLAVWSGALTNGFL